MKTVAISEFKARCLGLLEEVKATGEELVVTKRGAPIARVTPVEPAPSLEGSVTALVADEELIAPLADWDGE
jgi:prevent-host-death family protein